MKKQKGITLIALVITIIVLIILAGVTISALLGDDGIVGQAETAENDTNQQGEVEQIEMAYNAVYMKNKTKKLGEVTTTQLEEQLKSNGADLKTSNAVIATDSGFEIEFESGRRYSVNVANKEVKYIDGEGGNTITLASQITSANYGDYVNYGDNLGIAEKGEALADDTAPKTDWRIFYKNGENVFLIASDFLPINKVPSGVFVTTDNGFGGTWRTCLRWRYTKCNSNY